MPGLDRSLAFTALHDQSEDFRALAVDDAAEVITELLAQHPRYVRMYSGGVVKAGKTDLYTYSRIFIKTYFRPDE